MPFRIPGPALAAALALLCPPLMASAAPAEPPAEPKVLFIGNSLTFYNTGIDTVLGNLSVSLGHPVRATRKTNPGWTLKQHFEDPATHAALKADHYDYVVLQEFSGGTLEDPARFRTYAARLDSAVRASGARTVLFMTWTYSDERLYMGDSIAAAYNTAGRALGAPVVPAGWAWQQVLDETDYAMYADDRHPTFRGTYLAACLFYAQFTGLSAAGAPYKGILTEAEAAYLRQTAFEAWRDYQARPYALPGLLEAERFGNMQGMATEITNDAGGGRNLGYIQAGDWVDFPVDVKAAGRYKAEYRVAAQATAGRLAVLDSLGKALDTAELPVTGGFQAWRTSSSTVSLAAGNQVLRFQALAGGFNLNWIKFTLEPAVAVSRPGTPVARSGGGFRAWNGFDLRGRVSEPAAADQRGCQTCRGISALR